MDNLDPPIAGAWTPEQRRKHKFEHYDSLREKIIIEAADAFPADPARTRALRAIQYADAVIAELKYEYDQMHQGTP